MKMEDDATEQGGIPSKDEHREIRFKYVKSNYFRVIHADGAWGGLSAKGNIHMSFYSERAALPDVGTIAIGSDGKPIKPEQASSSGEAEVVREIECDVILDFATAVSLQKWLDDKIQALRDLIQEAQEQQRNDKSIKIG